MKEVAILLFFVIRRMPQRQSDRLANVCDSTDEEETSERRLYLRQIKVIVTRIGSPYLHLASFDTMRQGADRAAIGRHPAKTRQPYPAPLYLRVVST